MSTKIRDIVKSTDEIMNSSQEAVSKVMEISNIAGDFANTFKNTNKLVNKQLTDNQDIFHVVNRLNDAVNGLQTVIEKLTSNSQID